MPPKGFKAMAIWPFIFIRKDRIADFDEFSENRERIHFAQQKELLIIPFYLLYGIFHLIYGYDNNPFEKETHENGDNLNYLKERKYFAWLNHLK